MATQQNLSKIQEVSQRLSIPTHTLRFWEKELDGIIAPFRTPGGQRLYSDQTISIIEEIKVLRRKGMSLAQIRTKFMEVETVDNETDETSDIDLLAARVAYAVKSELYRFFAKTGNTIDQEKLFEKSWQEIDGEYPGEQE